MGRRRSAVAAAAVGLTLLVPACRFSRSQDDARSTDPTGSTVELVGEDTTTILEETTTTEEGGTTTSRRTATTFRSSATTRVTVRTAPPPPPPSPHCNATAADTTVGSPWSVTITSTFPNSEVTIDVTFSGGVGNYTGTTDSSGSFTKTQPRATPAMRGRVDVTARVGGKSCSTSFTVS